MATFARCAKRTKNVLSVLLCLSMVAGFILVPGGFSIPATAEEEPLPAYMNTKLSYEERAADLVSRMTLEEKQAQMKPPAPAIPRLGVPAYMYQNEALHGIAKNEGGTSFPSPLGMAQSWNPELVERIGTVVSDEIRAYYNVRPSNRGLSYYSPTMNLLRDPRWGRNEEAYSEDTFMTAVMAEMYVRGLQGIGDGVVNTNQESKAYGFDYIKVAPTLKHYAANNSEKNRNSGSSNVTNVELRDYYTWTFQRVVEKTKVASLMSAYNRVNEVPCAANKYLLDTLLRKIFGFNGFVVNDCAAMLNIVEAPYHYWKPAGVTLERPRPEIETDPYRLANKIPLGQNHPALYYDEATAYGVRAGNNMDCGGGGPIDWVYDKYTVMAVERGLLTEDEIDHNVYEIFLMRFRTGEFDGPDGLSVVPYKGQDKWKWETSTEAPEHLELALESALQAGVLLKNDNNALPIKADDVSKITVFGPLMNHCDLGDYSGNPKKRINFKQGMEMIAEQKGIKDKVSFHDGMSAASIPQGQGDMLNVRWIGFYDGPGGIVNVTTADEKSTGTFNPNNGGYYQHVSDGATIVFKNFDITKIDRNGEMRIGSCSPWAYNVIATFHIGSSSGPVLATIVCENTGSNWQLPPMATKFEPITKDSHPLSTGFSTKYNQDGTVKEINGLNQSVYDAYSGVNGGKHDIYITFTFDRNPQLDEEAINQADHDGVSIVYVGTSSGGGGANPQFAAYRVCNEGSDRSNIVLPAGQDELIKAVAAKTRAAGGKTVVVMQAVGPMDVSGFIDDVDAILYTAYNGQLQGQAHAMLLFGDYNPSGHLTQTWYKNDTQLYEYPSGFLNDYSINRENGKKGRTYMYYEGYKPNATDAQKPMFPFGYGLSYTNFTISNVDVQGPDSNGIIKVTADVQNNTSIPGAEVVQVYVQAPGAGSETVPFQQLKGFARVELGPNEKKSVTINIELKDLAVLDPNDTVDLSTVDDGALDSGDIDISASKHARRKLITGDYKFVVGYDSVTPAGSKTLRLESSMFPVKMKVVTLRNEKLAAKIGDTFGSEVTISLTDETFLDPKAQGVSITYQSDTPQVATVDQNGRITAVGGGTALIKAIVTYKGQTMEAVYPVAVSDSASLNDLKVNGQTVDRFRFNRYEYEVEVPISTTEIPKVTYDAPQGTTVQVENATEIPGTTKVTVSQEGARTVTYELKFKYPPEEGGIQEIYATFNDFAARGPWPGSNMYADWTNVDGGNVLNLKDHPNLKNLYLTFDIIFTTSDPSLNATSVFNTLEGASAVRLRSSDANKKPQDQHPEANNTEHNFGWRITPAWNLQWGRNTVEIPLYYSVTGPQRNGRDDNVDREDYKIKVNGVEVPARECGRGIIDWTDVRRIILMVFVNQSYRPSMSMALENVKIIDKTFYATIDELKEQLAEMLENKLEQGEATQRRYNDYLKAYEDAQKILAIANWVSPLQYAIDQLQTAIDNLYLPDYLLGDVDNNGKVNTTDARLTLQAAVQKIKLEDLNEVAEWAADVDGNGKINTTDARLILQYAVQKIDKFPAEEQE